MASVDPDHSVAVLLDREWTHEESGVHVALHLDVELTYELAVAVTGYVNLQDPTCRLFSQEVALPPVRKDQEYAWAIGFWHPKGKSAVEVHLTIKNLLQS